MLVPSFFFSLFLSGGSENTVVWVLEMGAVLNVFGAGLMTLGTEAGAIVALGMEVIFMAFEVGGAGLITGCALETGAVFIAFVTGAEVIVLETGAGFIVLGMTGKVGTVGTVIVAGVTRPIPSVLLVRLWAQLLS